MITEKHPRSDKAEEELVPKASLESESLVDPKKKLESYLENLNVLQEQSKRETSEALEMVSNCSLDGAEEESGKTEVLGEIATLDKEKDGLLLSAKQTLNQALSAYDSDLSWKSERDPYAPVRESLRQEKEKLKSRELKVLAHVAYKKVEQHAASLGLQISGKPEDAILMDQNLGCNSGKYDNYSDSIIVKSNSIKTIIHEELHFAVAVDNRTGKKNLGDNRLTKTGFASLWKTEGGQNRDNLRGLNEAVTEKITQDIFNSQRDSIKEEIIIADPELQKLNDELVEKEKEVALSDCERNLPEKYKTQQEYAFFEEDQKQSYEDLLAQERKKIESKCEAEKFSFRSQDILRNHKGYVNEVMLLDKILAKLAKDRATEEGISLEEAEAIEWQEMQRAYFKGETIYLRKVEKAFGPDILREISDIDPRDARGEKQDEYDRKGRALMARINSQL